MRNLDEDGTHVASAVLGDRLQEGGVPPALRRELTGTAAPRGEPDGTATPPQSPLENPVERATSPSSAATCRRKLRRAGSPPPPAGGRFHPERSFQTRSQPSQPSLRLLWLLFAAALVASFYLHEIGHCAVAWAHGCPAVPTPLKEYVLQPLSPPVQNLVSLGGIVGTVAALLLAMGWFLRSPCPTRSAILAGAMTAPGFYSLRFFLAGRGHDATEFQEAQIAVGFDYSGHALDWIFVGLFFGAAAVWFWRTRTRLTPRRVGRLLAGALAALVAVVVLQSVNNAVFDPLFQPRS